MIGPGIENCLEKQPDQPFERSEPACFCTSYDCNFVNAFETNIQKNCKNNHRSIE